MSRCRISGGDESDDIKMLTQLNGSMAPHQRTPSVVGGVVLSLALSPSVPLSMAQPAGQVSRNVGVRTVSRVHA
jgi:hypothetical protein